MGVDKVGEYRRHAILLFADLCDFTPLNELVDPEDVALILREMRSRVEVLVTGFGGSINEWRGDGVLCTFGLPHTTELDAQHAIEAALAMHATVTELGRLLALPAGFELCLHSGLHSGVVFATERSAGPGFDLVGDAVNTAARLCDRARRNELWVSADTIEGVRELFETDGFEQLVLKGKKSAVPAYRVIGRSEVTDRFAASQRRGLTPLVAREEALARLRASLNTAREGKIASMTVVGSPGAGKSRILEEFRRRALPFARVLSGRCEHTPNARPFEPFIEILLQALDLRATRPRSEMSGSLARLLRHLGHGLEQHESIYLHLLGVERLPSHLESPDAVQRNALRSLSDLMRALCAERPLVLMLDDWQWADDASRQVLGSLIRLLEQSPAMVVVASRELSDPILAALPLIALQPFTREESAQAISALLPFALNLGLKNAIHERSGGNPLFLEELCRSLPTVAPAGAEDLLTGKVPTTLRGIIQVRVERLSDDKLRVLWAAAVIGFEVPLWLLGQVTRTADLSDALRGLAREDFMHEVRSDHTLQFKHATTRDVVYESIRLPERRRLHREAFAALRAHAQRDELPEPYEELAYHSAGAGDPEQAAHFAELAGDKAMAASSLDGARRQYRVALDALDALDKFGLHAQVEQSWLPLISKWAAAALYSPGLEHVAVFERALARARASANLPAANRIQYWLGWFHYALGEQEPAIVNCQSAIATALNSGDERLAAQLQLNLGQSLAAAGRNREALEHFRAGLEFKRQLAGGSPRKPERLHRPPLGSAYALACKGLVHGDIGEFAQAHRCFDEAIASLHGMGQAVQGSCLGVHAMVFLLQGRWQDALDTARRAQAMAEQVNGPYVFATSQTVSGYARWMLERSPRALAELTHAVRWMEERGVGLYISFNYGYLADALLDSGELEAASDYAHRALARLPSDRLGEACAYRTLARLAVANGARHDAAKLLAQAMNAARYRESAREVALTDLEHLRLGLPKAEPGDPEVAFRAMGMDYYERFTIIVRLTPSPTYAAPLEPELPPIARP